MTTFKIGIDNYSLHPLQLGPLEILEWAVDNGAQGVQFSGLREPITDPGYLEELRRFAETHQLYLEWGGGRHIPLDLNTYQEKELLASNKQKAKEAAILNTRIIRSSSGGLMRWNPKSPSTETLMVKTAEFLKSQKTLCRDYNVILAIETHFEFTTFELLRIFEMCDVAPGDYLGICLDTMNLLTMLEDPLLATERILPYVVATHLKDGALRLSHEGLQSFPTAIGKGVIDLKEILLKLSTLAHPVNLSIEDHGGSFDLPIFNHAFLAEFPDLTAGEFTRLLVLSQRAATLMNQNRCTITNRKHWPRICQQQLKEDIQALKKLAGR